MKEFPENPEMRVSHETIYQAHYLQAGGGLKREVEAALRIGRARRKPRRDPQQRRSRFVDALVMIPRCRLNRGPRSARSLGR